MAEKAPVILVPIGFSEQSMLALDQAVVFAKAMKAELTLLSVINDDAQIRNVFDAKGTDDDKFRKQVKSRLQEVADEYSQKSNLKINTMVAYGVVYEEIKRVSELIDAKLVIMGTNGKPSNLRRRFIGSNAYRTAVQVKIPVITIKGVRNINKVDTIVFPLVLDRKSKEKVGPALHYARIFNSKVKIISVVHDKNEENTYRAHHNQVVKFIKDHGVECTAELIHPKKDKGIVRNTLNFAYENDGDLIIITEDDKERDITDYFMGTDVQAMIYHSEIPVMSITPRDMKWKALWEGM